MKIISVVGARPQFVKLAPIANAAKQAGVEHVIVHTGQHYDELLSDVFFSELGIPAPDVHLGVGSGSHGVQTGAMLSALDSVFTTHRPDWVLVYGDTNSTLAAAISAVKLQIPVAHLEAGLRSFNRAMPEEHNRVLTDHASDLLFAPTEVAANHLANEGLSQRTIVVGDVMTDVLLQTREAIAGRPSALVEELDLEMGAYYIATIHRAETTDDPERLTEVLASLAAADHPVILLAHPRLVARAAEFGLSLQSGAVKVHRPLGYPELVSAVSSSRGVITDSGGLQKEAFLLQIPCTTIRTETEWVETVRLGWNVLATTPTDIAAALVKRAPTHTSEQPYGDGNAAHRVIAGLQRTHSARQLQ